MSERNNAINMTRGERHDRRRAVSERFRFEAGNVTFVRSFWETSPGAREDLARRWAQQNEATYIGRA